MAYNAFRQQPYMGFNQVMSTAQEQFYGITSPSNYAQSPGFSETDIIEQASPQYSSSSGPAGLLLVPPSDALLDPYRSPSIEPYTPQNNGSFSSRLRGSGRMDLNDPVAMHLLVETAMGDSQDFEILSFEELESLKREQAQLSQKIEAVRRKFALESKVKDAAASLQRLYGKGRSPTGRAETKKDSVMDTSDELANATKKCDELSRDMYRLESRLRTVSTQLLRHTAGILQMTHKGPTKDIGIRTLLPDGMGPAIRPDSPASIFTYENGRVRSFGALDDAFDDRSLYRGTDNMGGAYENFTPKGLGLSALKEMPAKPSLPEGALNTVEQRLEDLNNRLRGLILEVGEAAKDGYAPVPPSKQQETDIQALQTLNSQIDYLGRALDDLKSGVSAQQKNSPQGVESRIQKLNDKIAKIITSDLASQSKGNPNPPKPAGGDLPAQLEYLEFAIARIDERNKAIADEKEERGKKSGETADEFRVVLEGLWQIIVTGEEERRQYKRQRREAIKGTPDGDAEAGEMSPDEDGSPNEPFTLPAFNGKVQWLYSMSSKLRDQSSILRRQIRQQRELNSKSDAQQEAMVADLNSQLDEVRAGKTSAERELSLITQKMDQLNKEMQNISSERTAVDLVELEALRNRERALVNDLRERDEGIDEREDRIEKLEIQLVDAITAAKDVKENKNVGKAGQGDLAAELEQKNALINELETALETLRDDAHVVSAEQDAKIKDGADKVLATATELAAVQKARAALEQRVKEKEDEALKLESEVIRLQTEVTIARAELEGAYGSRAERAADISTKEIKDAKAQIESLTAKNAEISTQLEGLKTNGPPLSEREKLLEDELAATLADFEELTRASVDNEKDRENLETLIDQLRDRIESLETQIADDKVRWLGMKSPGQPGVGSDAAPTAETTSTVVLKNEFKRLMRDARTENVKLLRAEQDERRRLEGVIRSLKKEQGKGGSLLAKNALTVP